MKSNDTESKIKQAFDHAAPDVFDKILGRIEGNAALKADVEAVDVPAQAQGAEVNETLPPAQAHGTDEKGTLKQIQHPEEDQSSEADVERRSSEQESGRVITFTSKESAAESEPAKTGRKRPWVLRSFLIALAAAAAIFIPVGISSYNAVNAIASVVSLEVNPSIEINVNKDRRVISVVPMNDDAKDIVGDMNFAGTDLNVTINALLGSMISKGYLSEIANSILISVDNADPAEAESLRQLLMGEVQKILKSDTFNGAIIGQTIKDCSKLRELAEKYGITMSKAQLIDEIVSQNAKLKFEDLVKLSINDLNLLKKSDSETVTSIGNASDSGYIGIDAATLTALENAGYEKDKVSDLKVGMDYDDGKIVYEVDFNAGGTTFEYEIDAASGKILKGELEKNEAQPAAAANTQAHQQQAQPAQQQAQPTQTQAAAAQPAQATQPAQPSLISYDQAKNSALSHAGVGAGSIYDYGIELDYDGGAHYEVEFKSGNAEYSYDINAYNGGVIWYEIDREDDYAAPQAAAPAQTQARAQAQAPAAPTDIGSGKAKSIALGHAGVSAGSARDLKVESDNDDGRIVYEVEFKAGGYEFSYEIDGSTGQILDVSKDEDD